MVVLIALALIGIAIFQVLPASAATLGVLDHVLITPTSTTVSVGGTVQFVAQGYDDSNTAIAGLTYAWNLAAGGGAINPNGLFTAGTAAGISTIQVTATQNQTLSKTATASVTVTANIPPVPFAKLEIATLSGILNSYLNSVGFNNFLGGQWQVKNGTAIDTIKAIPGIVQTASPTTLTLGVNP